MTDPQKQSATPVDPAELGVTQSEIGGRYSKYVLVVLVIVYIFNFIDRQILSILAEDIKADIGITDSEIGFLYGTAFAVFYAVFGIPLGRLADTWTRKSLISIGLAFWSLMTVLCGTARSFGLLATYRIGVGIGEASATPAAFSMLSDYFPPRLRSTALAVYSSGVYIGAGIGIFLGGVILDGWAALFPDPAESPLGLKGWHVAFFAVGAPGLLMALWVWSLKEPARGQSEGLITPPHPHPFRESWAELNAMLPPFNWVKLLYLGGGSKVILANLAGALVIGSIAWWAILQTGSIAQWTALGVGVYAAFSWTQSLLMSDPATFGMIFRSKTILFSLIGFPSMAFITYGLGFWGPPFFLRVHGASASESGTILGLSAAVGGWFGVTLGGVLADRLRARTVRAKLYVGMLAMALSVPSALTLLLTDSIVLAYVMNFVFSITSPMWVGPAAATVNDLVMPRMRAIASAFYILMITFIGLALGPYMIGQISDTIVANGDSAAAALREGMLWSLCMYALALTMLILAALYVRKEEETRLDRARALGEDV